MRCGRCFEVFDDDEEDQAICEDCAEARAVPVPALDVEAVFGAGGPLSAGNPAYEARPGQVRLSRGIFDALRGGHHLLAEGPCGIGKSKAYGVPAAYLASQGKKVLIVTASIALQEQLVKKDLPALQAELPWRFTYALMKGKNNYVCKEQIKTSDNRGLDGRDAIDFASIAEWTQETTTGDKSELLIHPSDLVWGRFATSSTDCPGRKCPQFKQCYATKARDKAAHAGILVTNYHMFFLNMAYGGTLLPAADVVILDEAHEAADIARELLGFRISEANFKRFARDAERRDPKGGKLVANALREAAAQFFGKLGRFFDSPYYAKLVRHPIPIDLSLIDNAIDWYVETCAKSHLVEAAIALKTRIREGIEVSNDNCVYWIDVKEGMRPGERRVSLQARFVSPAPILSSQLWDAYPSVVAVSATLTTDGRFDFLRGELGTPRAARELIVESPFDFPRQALLIVPPSKDLPEPNDPAFINVAAARMIEVIEACGGRTLGLFTSYRALNAIYDRVRAHFGTRIRVLRQGEMPTGLLAKTFKEDTRSVLLGTTSFWTGIDVPGEALTGLVIDRLPFGSPDDPVYTRLNERDPRAFANYAVPKSILLLRQGVGRLIRSQRDVGCVVVLDRRLTVKGYGARFLKSLPPMARSPQTSAIAPFLRTRGVAA